MKIVIFYSYVKLPEGTFRKSDDEVATHQHQRGFPKQSQLTGLFYADQIHDWRRPEICQLCLHDMWQCWYSNVINHPPVITILMGGFSTIPKLVVYDIAIVILL